MAKLSTTKESFVVFIDVLGFKDMIIKDGGSGVMFRQIKSAIRKAQKPLKNRKSEINHPFRFWYKAFKIQSFSDCFCFSIPLEFENGQKDYRQNFVAFYVWLMVFHNELLKLGFLCRGGIAQGWHYSSRDIIFSKALVDAYQMESKHANHPLIMIHPDLVSKLKEDFLHEQLYSEYLFSHDNDGRNFLNPFNYSIVDEIFFGQKKIDLLAKDIDERRQLLEMFINIIDKKIIENLHQPQIEKYQWMKELIEFTQKNKFNDKFKNGLL